MMDFGFDFGVWGVVSTIVASIFGGGFVGSFLTVRAQRKKATAEAKGAEATADSTYLDNVQKAITIWQETAENLQKELDSSESQYAEMAKMVDSLQKEVRKLNNTNKRIADLLDKLSHENLEKTVEEMKQVIGKTDA